MKSLKEIRDEILRAGATQRLLEVNKERDVLLKLLNHNAEREQKVLDASNRKYKRKGKRKPMSAAAKAKLSKIRKKWWADKRKAEHEARQK